MLSGNIVVHRSSHLQMDAIMPVFEAFRQQHPGVTLSFHSATCRDVAQALVQRVASIGFCTQVDPSIQRLRAQPLIAQEFGLYCGPLHPLYRRHDPDPGILAESDVVGFAEDHMAGALSALTIWRVRHGIGQKVVAASTGIVDLVELIESGTAIGCMARGHAARFGPLLWQIPPAASPPLVDVFSLLDCERHRTPVELALIEHLELHGLATMPRPASDI